MSWIMNIILGFTLLSAIIYLLATKEKREATKRLYKMDTRIGTIEDFKHLKGKSLDRHINKVLQISKGFIEDDKIIVHHAENHGLEENYIVTDKYKFHLWQGDHVRMHVGHIVKIGDQNYVVIASYGTTYWDDLGEYYELILLKVNLAVNKYKL